VERDQLEARRPSLVPQVLVLGGGLFGAGVSAAVALDRHTSVDGMMIGIAVACGVIATVAAVMLYFGLRDRFDIDERLANVADALHTAPQEAPPPMPAGPLEPVGPPPPPPPGASLLPGGAGLAVAW
jgi:hypothetical protein